MTDSVNMNGIRWLVLLMAAGALVSCLADQNEASNEKQNNSIEGRWLHQRGFSIDRPELNDDQLYTLFPFYLILKDDSIFTEANEQGTRFWGIYEVAGDSIHFDYASGEDPSIRNVSHYFKVTHDTLQLTQFTYGYTWTDVYSRQPELEK